jgi:hypothetical protein
MSLTRQGNHAEAEELLQAALASRRRVLGSSHPDTLATVKYLEYVRSQVLAKPTKSQHPVRTNVRSKRHSSTVEPLSQTQLAEAEARSRAAEAELLAMLELDDREAENAKGKSNGKAKKR